MDMKAKFLELLADSTIIQGLLTILVVGVWLYLVVTGQAVPDTLYAIVGTVTGFYFGSKSQNQIRRAAAAAQALESQRQEGC